MRIFNLPPPNLLYGKVDLPGLPYSPPHPGTSISNVDLHPLNPTLQQPRECHSPWQVPLNGFGGQMPDNHQNNHLEKGAKMLEPAILPNYFGGFGSNGNPWTWTNALSQSRVAPVWHAGVPVVRPGGAPRRSAAAAPPPGGRSAPAGGLPMEAPQPPPPPFAARRESNLPPLPLPRANTAIASTTTDHHFREGLPFPVGKDCCLSRMPDCAGAAAGAGSHRPGFYKSHMWGGSPT